MRDVLPVGACAVAIALCATVTVLLTIAWPTI
jgi:hypothetical protein